MTFSALAIPGVLAQLIGVAIVRRWASSSTTLAMIGWWAAVTIISFVVIEATLVVTRRLFPLATILKLGLAFPEATPSRFGMALRRGNPQQLLASIEAARKTPDAPFTDGVDPGSAQALLEIVTELSAHDRATRGHSERVRAYTEVLAEALDITADDRHRLRWAGLLHDIGKLNVPTEILNKTGSLTIDEYETIKRHPLDGLEMAVPLWPWLGEYVLAISDHHERWEGGGYPSGAAGTDIAYAGRIVAVADAFDVMTSHRSYKEPMSIDDARAELLRCAGTQFEPDVVRAFLGIPVRRLRAIVGPFAMISSVGVIRRAFEGLPIYGARAASAMAIAGLSVLGVGPAADQLAGTTVLGDSIERPVTVGANDALGSIGADGSGTNLAPGAADRGSDLTGGSDTASTRTPRASDGPGIGSDSSGSGNGPTTGVDTGSGTDPNGTDPDGSGTDAGPDGGTGTGNGQDPSTPNPDGDPDPGTDPGPGGQPNEPVALVIDPAEGEVGFTGTQLSDEEINVVDAPRAGAVVCGDVGVCEPIIIETPIVLPPL